MRIIPALLLCMFGVLILAGPGWAQTTTPGVTPDPGPKCVAPAPTDPDVYTGPALVSGTALWAGIAVNPMVRQLVPLRLVALWMPGLHPAVMREPHGRAVRVTRTTWGRVAR